MNISRIILEEVRSGNEVLGDLFSVVSRQVPNTPFAAVVDAVAELVAARVLIPQEVAIRKEPKCDSTGKFRAGEYRKRSSMWSRIDTE